ncbi:hypothetical protein VaNZ11_004858 [Volvox africanus]|uniref:Ankyrin repeat protein n=1 Tax=Volvox africanus TaxID=51714 RepID=A0ABQ5RX99_9CHLO|nr:hypothetical protein VaNZ11_004858 [Volvox africanus]
MQQTFEPLSYDASSVWEPNIVQHISSFLPENIIAGTLRLVNSKTAKQFSGIRTISLSFPVPTKTFKDGWGKPECYSTYTRKQRLQILSLTAKSGVIANLEVALDNAGLVVTSELLKAAAAAGHLDVCILLRKRGSAWGEALVAAARGGHRHICEWMLASGCPFKAPSIYEAARGSHLNLARWLLHHAIRRRQSVRRGELLAAAAEGLTLPHLRELHQRILSSWEDWAFGLRRELVEQEKEKELAAAACSLTPDWQAKVEWLEQLGYVPSVCVGTEIATRQHPEMAQRLMWLHRRGYPLGHDTVLSAARQGDLTALHFLVGEVGFPVHHLQGIAAYFGQLDVVQCLHSRGGVQTDPKILVSEAASRGHLSVLIWVMETAQGVTVELVPELLNLAAWSGNKALMIWLRQRGWGFTRDAVKRVVLSGCVAALEWLVKEQGCPLPDDGEPYVCAADSGDLAMTRCLARLGCPWGADLVARCFCRSTRPRVCILKLFVELGCPLDLDAAERAANRIRASPAYYKTEVLDWLMREKELQGGSTRRGLPLEPQLREWCVVQ